MEFDGFSLSFFYSFFFFLSTLLPLWLVGTKWNLLLLSEMASFLLQSALIWRHTDDTDDDDDDDDDDADMTIMMTIIMLIIMTIMMTMMTMSMMKMDIMMMV